MGTEDLLSPVEDGCDCSWQQF